MANLTEVVQENTVSFYYKKEQEEQEQIAIYEDLYKKSQTALIENIKMFDELGISFKLTNLKGKALLETEVLIFDEEGEPKLGLNLISVYVQEEGKDKYYSYYNIDAGVDSVNRQSPFTDEISLSLEYSNKILEILQKRPLKEFLNKFEQLYSKK